jgi:hypothetical protein
LEELLKALKENANEVRLSINQEITKYLVINVKRRNINRNTNVKMGQNNFERLQTYSFLGSIINDNNVNSEEILTRIEKGNKAFFMNKNLLSSKLISGKQSK